MAEPVPDPTLRRPCPGASLPDNEDLLTEILLRLPPEPCHLARASAVCKGWRRLVSGAAFLRRLRAFHREAPLLGVFHNIGYGPAPRFITIPSGDDGGGGPVPIPSGDGGGGPFQAAPFSIPDEDLRYRTWYFLGCRHGLALLADNHDFMVWNPMTGTHSCFPVHPDAMYGCYGAVLRDPGGDGDGDSDPFRVVLMSLQRCEQLWKMCAVVYSSASRSWGNVISSCCGPEFQYSVLQSARDWTKPACLVGNVMYWLLPGFIVGFDMVGESLDLINVQYASFSYWQSQLMLTRDGELGLAVMLGQSMQLWVRGNDIDGVARLTMQSIVELDKIVTLKLEMRSGEFPTILGFDENSYAIFVSINVGVFMVQLESMQSKIICQGFAKFGIFPYASFWAPAVHVGPVAHAYPQATTGAVNIWHYEDPQGVVQGPLSNWVLRKWLEHRFFPDGYGRKIVWRTDQTREKGILMKDLCR